MKQILIVDDDIDIGNILEEVLLKEGYKIQRAFSGTEAIMFLEKNQPDLILLDLMLPGITGDKIVSKIKHIPIIVVSANVDVKQKVELLLNGAVDYITKPFDIDELKARILVHTRNSYTTVNKDVLKVQDLILDIKLLQARHKEISVKLTRTETAILKLLMSKPNNVVAKSTILDQISYDTPDCTERSLKQHISNLRKKLQELMNKDCISTVWGIGFKLDI